MLYDVTKNYFCYFSTSLEMHNPANMRHSNGTLSLLGNILHSNIGSNTNQYISEHAQRKTPANIKKLDTFFMTPPICNMLKDYL